MTSEICLEALDLFFPKEPTYDFCVTRLNDFKKYAAELRKFFPEEIDEDSDDFDRLARVMDFDITKTFIYAMKDKDVASYEDFSIGVSIALKFKDAFFDFLKVVQSTNFQDLILDMLEFHSELDTHICLLWSYRVQNIVQIGPMLKRWGGSTPPLPPSYCDCDFECDCWKL